ncbi:MAG: 4-hydroxy-tetrahydrodipicolinate reductase [Phycisphaerae bacterium]|nr:4-hydroxy-tetrahydrodipicolinate reductase [Phycisphaerae bacterium]
MKPVRVAIAGCCGRMGRALVRLAASDAALRVTDAITGAKDPQLGRDAGAVAGIGDIGVPIRTESSTECDVLVEFTNPASCRAWAAWCRANGVALVSGTTGLTDVEHEAIRDAAQRVPVVWGPNMSVGVNLLLSLVRQAAQRLGHDWDCEIVEAHHRHKADAPSGTARALLNAVCAGRGDDPAQVAIYGREGVGGGRMAGQIGVHAVRMGEIVGDHDVAFGSPAEVLTLRHRALSRDTFAAGALRAAKWLVGRSQGLYTMQDVLSVA